MFDRVLLELHHRYRTRQITKTTLERALKILERDKEEIEDSPESEPENIADSIILLASL